MFSYFFFFFNDTATTEIYTLSLHDALPISKQSTMRVTHPVGHPSHAGDPSHAGHPSDEVTHPRWVTHPCRSEEHTSELQSRPHLVCRLLLEKKKKNEHSLDHHVT